MNINHVTTILSSSNILAQELAHCDFSISYQFIGKQLNKYFDKEIFASLHHAWLFIVSCCCMDLPSATMHSGFLIVFDIGTSVGHKIESHLQPVNLHPVMNLCCMTVKGKFSYPCLQGWVTVYQAFEQFTLNSSGCKWQWRSLTLKLVQFDFCGRMIIITLIPMSLIILSKFPLLLAIYLLLVALDNILDIWNLNHLMKIMVLEFNQAHQQQLSLGIMANANKNSCILWMGCMNF